MIPRTRTESKLRSEFTTVRKTVLHKTLKIRIDHCKTLDPKNY